MVAANITDELRNIDLTKDDATEQVKRALDNINVVVLPILNIPAGSRIYRATNLKEGEEVISEKRLSYKPAETNNYYQRASVPNGTAFYATYDPSINENGVVSSIYEVCPLIRNKFVPNQTATVVVSEWQVIKDVSLFALAATDGSSQSAYLNRIGSDFIPFLRQEGLPDEDISCLNEFQKYMTGRFTLKVDESNSYEYKISALFAEKIKEESQGTKGIDGLIWHSNLAVDPKMNETLALAMFTESADLKLQFSRCFKYVVTSDETSQIYIINREDITNLITD